MVFAGNRVNLMDFNVLFANKLEQPLYYLEIGVSVGKSLWTQMKSQCGATFVAFDIEFINPSFHRHLLKQGAHIASEVVWDIHNFTASDYISPKKTECSWAEYTNVTLYNHFNYLACDEYDLYGWQYLQNMAETHPTLV
jgi:hypothetical protein